ncbi:hypothetical protein EUZ85_23070 [Hahella sp. KA22]|uniref:collagenase n=1 Tax=Hahella sp. KA22 TaxID=1628392 RepID=UPI000FDE4672|nr:collagenase [Hahella sp. KA22]AZZ93444.1 hypothetical protein ENC22_20490 [Hahella sp. KA22]QAY56819.1 hypothetical protein EUZ85_23070 [Hahella sp. KA22]
MTPANRWYRAPFVVGVVFLILTVSAMTWSKGGGEFFKYFRHNSEQPEKLSELPPPLPAYSRAKEDEPYYEEEGKSDCYLDGLSGLSGDEFVLAIWGMDHDCVRDMVFLEEQTLPGVFSEANMSAVTQAAISGSSYFQDDNFYELTNLIQYLHAGYVLERNRSRKMKLYGKALQKQVAVAVVQVTNNALHGVIGADGARLAVLSLKLVNSSDNQGTVVNDSVAWLEKLGRLTDANGRYDSALNELFNIYYKGHDNDAFIDIASHDPQFPNALYRFIVNKDSWLVGSREYLLMNAVKELGRFLQYKTIKDDTGHFIRNLINRYDLSRDTANVWSILAGSVDYYDKSNCRLYNACDFRKRVETVILRRERMCGGTVRIRAQTMTEEQFDSACEALSRREDIFHQMLNSDREPVADDQNDSLEMVIFKDSDTFVDLGWLLFDSDAVTAGGVFYEGDPFDEANQARVLAYQSEEVSDSHQILNLDHEFVHYLDGRFTMYGLESEYVEDNVWWAEGVAEYIALQDHYPDAEEAALSEMVRFSDIIHSNYKSDESRIYHWGYWAVRYMFEQRPDDVERLAKWFRHGRYEDYQDWLKDEAKFLDADFAKWMAAIKKELQVASGV